jgi:hypothetical protein
MTWFDTSVCEYPLSDPREQDRESRPWAWRAWPRSSGRELAGRPVEDEASPWEGGASKGGVD